MRSAALAATAPGGRLRWAAVDAITVTQRNLIALVRIPQALFFASVQPIMFVLLFRYVFGGAIQVPGVNYVDYVMPGIFVQTVGFGGIGTAIGLSEDLHKGLIERFRALPMARSAVLAGRTLADLVRNFFVILLITGVGYAVGFRVHTNLIAYLGALSIMLLFAYALAWGFAIIGLMAPNSEVAQTMGFPVLFPLIFISSAFVPVQSMPGPLQVFANNQPVSIVINAVRGLMLGGPVATDVWKALAWCVGILAVLIPLAVHRYRRSV